MNVNSVKLPSYFYSLDGILPDGTQRWYDEFADESDTIWTPGEASSSYKRRRYERNVAYSKWQASFCTRAPDGSMVPMFKPKMMKWQAIRVLAFKHSESSSRDWWENYQDAIFRVFIQPETVYAKYTGEHKQWYLLCPEDCFLVNRYEAQKNNPSLKPRDRKKVEKWLPLGREMRRARLIPVECCHHLRNETTGGVLPEGL